MIMKKSRVFLIVLFSFFYVSLNAQVFVGGNFGLSTSGGSTYNGTTTTDKTSGFSSVLSPKAGIFLSEKLAVGAALDFTYNRSKTSGDPATISRASTIGLTPFLRYYAVTWNKFSVFGQGNIGLSFSGSTVKVGDTSTEGPKTTSFHINAFPGLAYNVSDKLSLETTLNILSFGYYNSTEKDGDFKDITSTFNIGAGLNNLVTVGAITIGAIYKF
jgi:hypothetical protein